MTSHRKSVRSNRLPGWNYTEPWWYYVTICTRNHVCHFGRVVDATVLLSPAGRIVDEEWRRTERVRPNVKLDAYVVMPNHLHGIIAIVNAPHRGASTPVSSPTLAPDSLGSIIGQFKSVVTKRVRALGYSSFQWQPRFYDRIIRDEHSLHAIRDYIDLNPKKWDVDKGAPQNLPPLEP